MAYRYTLIAISFVLLQGTQGQSQNALDFDGIDDRVVVPAASSLITSGTGISLTCWVYPMNTTPAYPDFDCFAGMRNDNDADFYLLQVSPSNLLEGRFTGSDQIDHTLEFSGLAVNEWQFLVLTYTGIELTMYHNGVNVATATATGSITNASQDLLIGDLLFQAEHFRLHGRVDEVSLWNKALTPSEISCIYTSGIDVTSDGLQLYYKMDQGSAGGNNASITTLIDAKANIDGTLSGFMLNGASSNFVAGPAVGNSLSASLCPGETYAFNGVELSEPGVYSATYDIGEVCDSLVTLTLNMGQVDTLVIATGGTLISTAALGPWQWLDCGNGYAPIPGATTQSWTATVNGSYAVQVVGNGCTDTSSCHSIITAGITQRGSYPEAAVFPIPATDRIHIAVGHAVGEVTVTLLDLNGREILRRELGSASTIEIPVEDLNAGIYLVRIRTAEGSAVYRVPII